MIPPRPAPGRGRRRPRAALKRRWYRQRPEASGGPGPGSLRPAPDTADAGEVGGAGWLACARCGHRVTPLSARTEVAGQHVHTRLNPHGYIWRFGCFSSAPGVREATPPTTEFTWFSGHAWQIAHCGRCDVHLGWRFLPPAGSGSFFGLILELLVEVETPAEDRAPSPPGPA